MNALPLPCIRPAQDRIFDALEHMGEILANGDGIESGISDGLLLKDPGLAFYVYERRDGNGPKTAIIANCALEDVAATLDARAATASASPNVATSEDILDLRVQPRATSLAYADQPVMDVIISAAKQGAALFELTDPAGADHRIWEVKRKDAVDAIRTMLDQTAAPVSAGDDAQAAAAVAADRALCAREKENGSFTGKEPFNFVMCALWPVSSIASGTPTVPLGLLMHQVDRF